MSHVRHINQVSGKPADAWQIVRRELSARRIRELRAAIDAETYLEEQAEEKLTAAVEGLLADLFRPDCDARCCRAAS
jgi:hypothetical protein